MKKKASKKTSKKKKGAGDITIADVNRRKGYGGRNPLPEGQRKIRVEVFIEGDRIKARGGMDAMKQHLYQSA